MANSIHFLLTILTLLIAVIPFSLCDVTVTDQGNGLRPDFYQQSCPNVFAIVRPVVKKAVAKDPRMAASLLRLHFHDCFVQGCDASVLLDSTPAVTSEKRSVPNVNSLRGFETIDEIKAEVEKKCRQTVSCADIVALAARDSTVLVKGPHWEVLLGRKDSRNASMISSNRLLPAPNDTLTTILKKFQQQRLNLTDLVTLSGGHTIGDARCTSFRQRLYQSRNQGSPLDESYAATLRKRCPKSGKDQTLFNLDPSTATTFDNSYFKNLLNHKGLLSSDQVLATDNALQTLNLVNEYARNQEMFFNQFSKSMVKMGNISPPPHSPGEIRTNCRRINSK